METLKSVPSSLLTCCLPLSVLLPGHDCSIRLWNMESKTCIQEFTAHRKKFEESIHDVAFHPTKCYIGSAGADALAKVFVWPETGLQPNTELRGRVEWRRGNAEMKEWRWNSPLSLNEETENWRWQRSRLLLKDLSNIRPVPSPPFLDLGWPGSQNKQTSGWDDEWNRKWQKIKTGTLGTLKLKLESYFLFWNSTITNPKLSSKQPIALK